VTPPGAGATATGPLAGLRVVEIAGIGPGPFTAMLLADMGAEVVRVDRVSATASPAVEGDVVARGRRSVRVDLKHADGRDVALALVDRADVLIEGFRPGVMERLGLGPDACLGRNPRLVYGRMTGWGQDGPLAPRAGHDIDYIALAGALRPIGRADEPPPPPLNLVGDYGGGGMLLAFGIVCALQERERSGRGQVVDAAMLDGAALLTTVFHGLIARGRWSDEREANLLDGGAPYYRTYRCADGEFLAVGAIEPQFFAELLQRLDLEPAEWPQNDRSRWADQAEHLARIFAGRTRDEWASHFEGTDACVAPVLSLTEATRHPHAVARGTFVEQAGVRQPAPAPRFSRTPPQLPNPPTDPGRDTDALLRELGLDVAAIQRLRSSGAVG
jgi:alpha-methylacyl-CoA racemase